MASSVGAAEKLGASVPDLSVSVPVSGVSDRVVTVTVTFPVVSVPISVGHMTVLGGRKVGVCCSCRGTILGPVVQGRGSGCRRVMVIVADLSVVTLPSIFACWLGRFVEFGVVKGCCLVGRGGVR